MLSWHSGKKHPISQFCDIGFKIPLYSWNVEQPSAPKESPPLWLSMHIHRKKYEVSNVCVVWWCHHWLVACVHLHCIRPCQSNSFWMVKSVQMIAYLQMVMWWRKGGHVISGVCFLVCPDSINTYLHCLTYVWWGHSTQLCKHDKYWNLNNTLQMAWCQIYGTLDTAVLVAFILLLFF